MAFPDVWSEYALISITKQAGSDIEFATIIDSIRIKEGDKDIDLIATMGGGRLVVTKPQGPVEISFDAYPVDTDPWTTPAAGVAQLFDSPTTNDITDPKVSSTTRFHNKYRVAILYTGDTAATSGAGATAAATNSFRYVLADCYCTGMDTDSSSSDPMKVSLTFKGAPLDKTGTANRKIESSATALAALAAYTASVKF